MFLFCLKNNKEQRQHTNSSSAHSPYPCPPGSSWRTLPRHTLVIAIDLFDNLFISFCSLLLLVDWSCNDPFAKKKTTIKSKRNQRTKINDFHLVIDAPIVIWRHFLVTIRTKRKMTNHVRFIYFFLRNCDIFVSVSAANFQCPLSGPTAILSMFQWNLSCWYRFCYKKGTPLYSGPVIPGRIFGKRKIANNNKWMNPGIDPAEQMETKMKIFSSLSSQNEDISIEYWNFVSKCSYLNEWFARFTSLLNLIFISFLLPIYYFQVDWKKFPSPPLTRYVIVPVW